VSAREATADPITERYEMVVGLEVQVQLRTKAKAFC
jgi:Asp-tRNA(Asn)/Glu-tRNA(Gln) amidotransferase B subunit